MSLSINNQSNIVVENLNVFYNQRHALKNINITIPSNKLTAIIGPSGCGKTTFLKCFNRLIENNDNINVTGNFLVNGQNIYQPNIEITEIRKKMGLLSQRPYPLPMSIYDNITYGPKIHGEKNKEKLDHIVEFYLKEANLWEEVKDRLHSPANNLSIGQQQRLCLARGLAVEPEFILGDEPTSALDPISSKHIEQKFLELKNKYTIVLVTHSLRQAKKIADYVIFMYLGEIIEHGSVEEVLLNPKNQLTKDYVNGEIN
ncbi:MAG: phosphate ABC transporter ATP-binding protein [Cytophagales bacterium]|nr:MAG: phosphate ABC transporter ATP-binding protein [Cytophagales bacterium]